MHVSEFGGIVVAELDSFHIAGKLQQHFTLDWESLKQPPYQAAQPEQPGGHMSTGSFCYSHHMVWKTLAVLQGLRVNSGLSILQHAI